MQDSLRRASLAPAFAKASAWHAGQAANVLRFHLRQGFGGQAG